MYEDVMKYILDEALFLIPALWVIGFILKSTPAVKDWTIPWVVVVLGVVGALLKFGLNIDAVVQGVLVGGATVFVDQIIKQTAKKE